ncbi:putative mitochondrial protein AtMg00860 [Wolffia australiana]
MKEVLHLFIARFIVVYFDDILIFSGSREDHLQHLREVCTTLQWEKLYTNSKKYSFFMMEVSFIGFIISAHGVSANPTNIEAINSWPQPKDIHEVRSFMGLTTFYRRFIPGFSSITAPIIDLIRLGKFEWTKAADKAFEEVKRCMTEAPMLRLSDFNKVFEVACDASGVGINGVLNQDRHLVEYFSEKLNDMRRRYDNYDRKFHALMQPLCH